jgi:hypothetical protein
MHARLLHFVGGCGAVAACSGEVEHSPEPAGTTGGGVPASIQASYCRDISTQPACCAEGCLWITLGPHSAACISRDESCHDSTIPCPPEHECKTRYSGPSGNCEVLVEGTIPWGVFTSD